MSNRHTFRLIVRAPWGAEYDLGGISVDSGARSAETKAALAASLSAIAAEVAESAWDGPTQPTPWLDNVDLVEFTDTIRRDRAFLPAPGVCAALPARAFRGRYRSGCVADEGHTGNHTTSAAIAERMRRRDGVPSGTTRNQ